MEKEIFVCRHGLPAFRSAGCARRHRCRSGCQRSILERRFLLVADTGLGSPSYTKPTRRI